MDQKANKVFLPTTYQQFIQQKKKIVKPINTIKPTTISHQFQKENHTNNNTTQKDDYDQQINQKEDNKKPTNVVIIEKVVYSDYKKMFDDFNNNKFDSIKNKIMGQLKRLKQNPPIEIPSVSDILNKMQIQSLQNIKAIKEQYGLPPGKRNIDRLEKMLCFNKFFIILNKEKRWKIFDNSVFEEYQAGQIIYKEGDTDEYMFVIIKGCVKQYQKKITSYNTKISVNFTSHYQGSNFGQVQGYGQNQTKGKRYHTIETTQKCYLLKILNSYYRQLISNSAQDDFQKKLNALMYSSIFKQTSKLMVTPLMSTLEKHILPYGKVLIRQDEEVKKLYFVADGNLKIIYLDRAKRSIRHLNIQEKPQNFSLNKPKSREKARSKTKNFSIHNTFYYPETSDTSKEFIFGKKRLFGEQIEYNDQIVFNQLRVGDFFGGKSFLSHVDKQKKEEKSKYFDPSLKARLSIISSSTQSLVYSIDEKKFFSLSENLQKLIIKGIMQQSYFDEYNIEDKVSAHREWKKYSQKMTQNVIKDKKERTHSFRM